MSTQVALTGAGRLGNQHVHEFRSLPVEVVALCEPDPEQRAGTQQEYGISASSATLTELLEHEDVDMIDVVFDESSHAELVLQAARAGRHVFVQKPLAMSET